MAANWKWNFELQPISKKLAQTVPNVIPLKYVNSHELQK